MPVPKEKWINWPCKWAESAVGDRHLAAARIVQPARQVDRAGDRAARPSLGPGSRNGRPGEPRRSSRSGTHSPSELGTVIVPSGARPRPSGLRKPVARISTERPSAAIRSRPGLLEAV